MEYLTRQQRIQNLVDRKFFIAGGSARLMFRYSTDEAIDTINNAIARTSDCAAYFDGHVGDASNGVVNSLLARYEKSSKRVEIRLVSRYAAREMAMCLGPRLISRIKAGFHVNPSMDGHFFEIWFFAMLTSGGIDLVHQIKERFHWQKSDVIHVGTSKSKIDAEFGSPVWLAPKKWNQGGYDAVHVDKAERIVRFIQVTRGGKHSFKPLEFCKLLIKLDGQGIDDLRTVELYFVVPKETQDQFNCPISDLELKRDVVEVAFPSSGIEGRVYIVGADYEISGPTSSYRAIISSHHTKVSQQLQHHQPTQTVTKRSSRKRRLKPQAAVATQRLKLPRVAQEDDQSGRLSKVGNSSKMGNSPEVSNSPEVDNSGDSSYIPSSGESSNESR